MIAEPKNELEVLQQITGAPDYAKRSLHERAALLQAAHAVTAESGPIGIVIALEAAVLASAGHSLRDRIAALESENAGLRSETTQAKAEAAAALKTLNDFTPDAALAAARARVAALEVSNAALASKEQDLAKRATDRAVEIMASVGQPVPVRHDVRGSDVCRGISITDECKTIRGRW